VSKHLHLIRRIPQRNVGSGLSDHTPEVPALRFGSLCDVEPSLGCFSRGVKLNSRTKSRSTRAQNSRDTPRRSQAKQAREQAKTQANNQQGEPARTEKKRTTQEKTLPGCRGQHPGVPSGTPALLPPHQDKRDKRKTKRRKTEYDSDKPYHHSRENAPQTDTSPRASSRLHP
jgi:hypothetical protein